MMDRRKALTLSFTVDQDKLVDKNPLRIPMTCLPSGGGRLEGQVSWTAIPGCKHRKSDSEQMNGSRAFDHNHATMVQCGVARRKPCLILTDVLKTKQGIAYLERVKQNRALENKEQTAAAQRERRQSREENALSRTSRSSHSNTSSEKNKPVTPRRNQRSTASQRPRHRRRSKPGDDEEEEEEAEEGTDMEEVMLGGDGQEDVTFAEVVDCGLSVRWEPGEDVGGERFSPTSIKDSWSESEHQVQQCLKRKINEADSRCNGTSRPKRRRESVLRLTRDDIRDGGLALAPFDPGEDGDLDSSIVKFTVGAEDGTSISRRLDADDSGRSTGRVPSAGLDAATRPFEPIVLSSDDEERGDAARGRRPLRRTVLAPEDSVIRRQPSQPDTPELQDLEVLRVVVAEPAGASPAFPASPASPACPAHSVVDYPCINVAFLSLHSGGFRAKANGALMIVNQKIIIPLKDSSDQLLVKFTSELKELRRYSVWEQQELEDCGLFCRDLEEPRPAAVLLLFVSENAAAALHRDLQKLHVAQDGNTNLSRPSPFILLTLNDPLEGINGALLRSLLDIHCLTSMNMQDNYNGVDGLAGMAHPHLSLHDSWNLIRRTGLDPHLLTLLGVETSKPQDDLDQDSPHSDGDKTVGPHIWLEVDLQNQTVRQLNDVLELDKEPELDIVVELDKTPELDSVPELDKTPDLDAGPDLDKASALDPGLEPDKVPDLDLVPELVTVLQVETVPGGDKVAALEAGRASEAGTEPKPEVHLTSEQSSDKSSQGPAPVYTLCRRKTQGTFSVTMHTADSTWVKYRPQGLARRLIQFPPPPLKGGITVTMEDLQCLDSGQYLNDVIIDFYLKYLLQESSRAIAERSHVFSSFFYKQLTRRDNASEGGASETCQRQRRHQRVKTWTRHVDIFKKDFLFVPVNQEAHWYLVVICFPGLDGTKTDAWKDGELETRDTQDQEEAPGSKSSSYKTVTASSSEQSDTATRSSQEDPGKAPPPVPVNCTEKTCQRSSVCKRPCILIMDSLQLSLHERVFKLLREYLQSEWEVRRGSSREFGPDQIKSSHCKVPLQDNSSDCGLYLLQYVESFLKDPVVHFDLPLQLQRWFPRQQVRRKREEIRDLVLKLYRHQNLNKK